jgi:hypothetical protein
MTVPVEDTWAEAESALSTYLRAHPDVERALLETPLEQLAPADAYLRGSVLEERAGFDAARETYAFADEGLYSADVRAARDASLARVVDVVRAGDGPIVDVATGRGTLLERLLRGAERPLVATDVSPTILAQVRRRLGEERVRYVVADARSLPFDDASVPTLVSHIGLANVPDGEALLRELRRVGRELVVTHVFYPADDETNRTAAAEHGLETLLFRATALEAFRAAGWEVEIEDERGVASEPTPESVLIPGVRIDGIPVAETIATWCMLRAR